MIDATFMNALLEFISKGPQGAPAATAVVAASNRTALAADLRSYGEDSVASALEAATDDTVLSIAQRGIQIVAGGRKLHRYGGPKLHTATWELRDRSWSCPCTRGSIECCYATTSSRG